MDALIGGGGRQRVADEDRATDSGPAEHHSLGGRGHAVAPRIDRLERTRRFDGTDAVGVGLDHGKEAGAGNREHGPGIGDEGAKIDISPGTGRRDRI